MAPPQASTVLLDGPWTHREISANGARFHAVEAGTGPLVLLLHGFPQFWWAWRNQLPELARHGLRAVAVDLRGYGASDKTPRGYDAVTVADDVASLIRALGETSAVLVGHDWGGLLAWSVAALQPALVRSLVVIGIPHPLALRRSLLRAGPQLLASRYLLRYQLPWHPERLLVADHAAYVGRLLREWSGPAGLGPGAVERYRSAMLIPGVAHCALEYHRWALRSLPRPDGRRFAAALGAPISAPTLQLHGALDPCILPATAAASRRYVTGRYEWHLEPDAGHFPAEECPERVSEQIRRWAS